MKQFEHEGIIVNICTNIYEWGKEFYDIPDNAILENLEELESECMGFASIYEGHIYIYIPPKYELVDLFSVTAHELGHVTEPDFPPSPDPDNEDANEQKAMHYEIFTLDVLDIVHKITELLCDENHANANTATVKKDAK